MNITYPSGGCVYTAVSTMRAALGYRTAYPRGVPLPRNADDEHPGMLLYEVVENCHKFFPNHKVVYWCSEGAYNVGGKQEGWLGTTMPASAEEYNGYLFMFAYNYDDCGHAVVGFPVILGGISISLVIAVRIKRTILERLHLGTS